MSATLDRPAVQRVRDALERAGLAADIQVQDGSSRSAVEAAASLGITVGQIASSIIFRLPNDLPLLVITSGRHRVNEELVAREVGVPELLRADAHYVKVWSGFSIGGVAPVGWSPQRRAPQPSAEPSGEVTILIDEALNDYDVIWAAAGHPHAVFPTSFADLQRATGARAVKVALDD
jgi:prolyl-tRNA editing enzyme YbaK/EbsC (Cys-tRNA(Pro) deacylase)